MAPSSPTSAVLARVTSNWPRPGTRWSGSWSASRAVSSVAANVALARFVVGRFTGSVVASASVSPLSRARNVTRAVSAVGAVQSNRTSCVVPAAS